jgi:hypothetical protein
MAGRDLVEYDEEQEAQKREERWEAYEAYSSACKAITVVFKQLTEATKELNDEFIKCSALFTAYCARKDALDDAYVAATKRSKELDDVYEQLEAPMPKPKLKTRRDAH